MTTSTSLTPAFINIPGLIGVSLDLVGESFVVGWIGEDGEHYEETYGSLSVALARLSVLAYCGEGDDPWIESFAHPEDTFTKVAADWLDAAVG